MFCKCAKFQKGLPEFLIDNWKDCSFYLNIMQRKSIQVEHFITFILSNSLFEWTNNLKNVSTACGYSFAKAINNYRFSETMYLGIPKPSFLSMQQHW